MTKSARERQKKRSLSLALQRYDSVKTHTNTQALHLSAWKNEKIELKLHTY